MWEIPQHLSGVQDRGGLSPRGCRENVPGARRWDQWGAWTRAFPEPRLPGPPGRAQLHARHGPDPGRPCRKAATASTSLLAQLPRPLPRLRQVAAPPRLVSDLRRTRPWSRPSRTPSGTWAGTAFDMANTCTAARAPPAATRLSNRPCAPRHSVVIDFSRDIVAIGDRKAAGMRTQHGDPRPHCRRDHQARPSVRRQRGGSAAADPGDRFGRRCAAARWSSRCAEAATRSRQGRSPRRCAPSPRAAITTTSRACPPTSRRSSSPTTATGACPVTMPVGTFTTKDRWALAIPEPGSVDLALAGDLSRVLYRMLEPDEIGLGMGFGHDYEVLGNRAQQVRQYGNAVTPAVAEILVSALVEAIEGIELPRYSYGLAA
ncbi:DNA cytosine methyltransferase [Yinghuangia aomiensis]